MFWQENGNKRWQNISTNHQVLQEHKLCRYFGPQEVESRREGSCIYSLKGRHLRNNIIQQQQKMRRKTIFQQAPHKAQAYQIRQDVRYHEKYLHNSAQGELEVCDG